MNLYPGTQNLRSIEVTCLSFNKIIINRFENQLKGRVLELGCGLGTFTSLISNVDTVDKIVGIDVDKSHIEYAKNNFHSNKLDYIHLDMFSESMIDLLVDFKPNIIIAINVFEHLKDHESLLKTIYSNCDAKLLIYVPAIPFLYCKMDAVIHHYRRYSKNSLKDVIYQSGYKQVKIFWFNFIGIFGWFVYGKILRRGRVNTSNLGIFNKLYDISNKLNLEYIFNKFIGLSLISLIHK